MKNTIDLCFLLILVLKLIKSEQIWLVKFPDEPKILRTIEKSFPLIDLIQHQSSNHLFLVPTGDQSDFGRFISDWKGTFRVVINNVRHLTKPIHERKKRWVPSMDPLDEVYYKNFLSYDEQKDWFRLLKESEQTKKFISLHEIGRSYENRSLTVVEVRNGFVKRRRQRRVRKQAVLIDGGMHAREWISIGVANYLLIQFLQNKDKDRKVQEIFRRFDLYFLPMLNPDGYEYSRTVDRLWRKNRAPTTHSDFWNGDPSCFGTDLNRNFPFQWNSPSGSSFQACSPAYRGPNANSELEVQSLVKFLASKESRTRRFFAYFNLHSYGKLWLLPWAYSKERLFNYDELYQRAVRVNSKMTNNSFVIGQTSVLLYECSGTSLDFAASLMPHSMTFELSPIFKAVPFCYERNKTVNETCFNGFILGPEAIQHDGQELFHIIVEYLYSLIEDKAVFFKE